MPVKVLDGPPCIYCGSVETGQLHPDAHPFSPWECMSCGAVFGTERTSARLLEEFGRPPTPAEVPHKEHECFRCGTDLSDPSLERLETERGLLCDECVRPGEEE